MTDDVLTPEEREWYEWWSAPSHPSSKPALQVAYEKAVRQADDAIAGDLFDRMVGAALRAQGVEPPNRK